MAHFYISEPFFYVYLCKIKVMKTKQRTKLLILFFVVLIAVGLSLSYYLYTRSSRSVTAKHFIDSFGQDVRFGKPTMTTDNSALKVSGQMVGVGRDVQGDYANILFQTIEGKVVSQKIRIGGDTGDVYVLLHRQNGYDFDPTGNIGYEKITVPEVKKILSTYKGPISFSIYLNKEFLSRSPNISSNLLDKSISCNTLFSTNLASGTVSTDCRPLVLQLNIVNE